MAEFKLTRVYLDGCMFNLRSRKSGCEDVFPRKRWCVATDSRRVADELGLCCTKDHEHMRICGSDTKFTEGYAKEFTEAESGFFSGSH